MTIYYKSLSGMTYVQNSEGRLYLPQQTNEGIVYRQISKKAVNPLELGLRYAGNYGAGISDWKKQEFKKYEGN